MPWKPIWTKERIFEAFEAWEKEHGSPPRSTQWKLAGENHPTDRAVHARFGTWRQALDEYEATREERRSRTPPNFWNREKIIHALQEWGKKHDGLPPTTNDTRVDRNDGTLPSHSTVKHYCGSWNGALAQAGFYPIPRGLTRYAVDRYKPLPRSGRS